MHEIDVGTIHHFSSGVYAKQMHLPAGYMAVSHKHAYDHLSILATGEVDVTVDGVSQRYIAPACLEVKAGLEHKIVAYKDATWFCIHAVPDELHDASTIDEVLIAKEG